MADGDGVLRGEFDGVLRGEADGDAAAAAALVEGRSLSVLFGVLGTSNAG